MHRYRVTVTNDKTGTVDRFYALGATLHAAVGRVEAELDRRFWAGDSHAMFAVVSDVELVTWPTPDGVTVLGDDDELNRQLNPTWWDRIVERVKGWMAWL